MILDVIAHNECELVTRELLVDEPKSELEIRYQFWWNRELQTGSHFSVCISNRRPNYYLAFKMNMTILVLLNIDSKKKSKTFTVIRV